MKIRVEKPEPRVPESTSGPKDNPHFAVTIKKIDPKESETMTSKELWDDIFNPTINDEFVSIESKEGYETIALMSQFAGNSLRRKINRLTKENLVSAGILDSFLAPLTKPMNRYLFEYTMELVSKQLDNYVIGVSVGRNHGFTEILRQYDSLQSDQQDHHHCRTLYITA